MTDRIWADFKSLANAAVILVNIGVIVLRRTEPDMERGFRVPFVPWFPLIGIALCIYLMTRLEALTWLRFGVWLAIEYRSRAPMIDPALFRSPQFLAATLGAFAK